VRASAHVCVGGGSVSVHVDSSLLWGGKAASSPGQMLPHDFMIMIPACKTSRR
jgi:hypothetical protein